LWPVTHASTAASKPFSMSSLAAIMSAPETPQQTKPSFGAAPIAAARSSQVVRPVSVRNTPRLALQSGSSSCALCNRVGATPTLFRGRGSPCQAPRPGHRSAHRPV
jgi:hypothetical protein